MVSLIPGNFCSGRCRQLLSGHGRRQSAGNLTTHGLPYSDSARQKFQSESDEATSNSQSQIRKQIAIQLQTDPAPPPWVSPAPKSNSTFIPRLCRVFNTNTSRSKKKWAKDPNNTFWSRNIDTFGHKILRSQGWEPGQYLGAENASHSEYYGAANASHIRAVLKDDSLGLGAKRNQGDECTGLDALQDLLSRLNGKSEESLGEEQKKREDLKINKYLHRKLGTVTFVYGGLLVGDKVQELADSMKDKTQSAAQVPVSEETSGESSEAGKKEKKSKKRKAEDGEGAQKEKKSKKSKSQDADEASKSKRKEKKDKKRRKEKDASDRDEDSSPDADEDASDRKKAKKEKKEKRRKSKLENDDEDAADVSEPKSKKSKKKSKSDKEEPTPQPTESSTPTASGTSTPSIPTRHLARSRFIAQKRAAVMDQAALNQVNHELNPPRRRKPRASGTLADNSSHSSDIHDQDLNERIRRSNQTPWRNTPAAAPSCPRRKRIHPPRDNNVHRAGQSTPSGFQRGAGGSGPEKPCKAVRCYMCVRGSGARATHVGALATAFLFAVVALAPRACLPVCVCAGISRRAPGARLHCIYVVPHHRSITGHVRVWKGHKPGTSPLGATGTGEAGGGAKMSCICLAGSTPFAGASDEQGVLGRLFGGRDRDRGRAYNPAPTKPVVPVLELRIYIPCTRTNQRGIYMLQAYHMARGMQWQSLFLILQFSFHLSLSLEQLVQQAPLCVNLVRYRNARLDHLSVLPHSQNHQNEIPLHPTTGSAWSQTPLQTNPPACCRQLVPT